MLDGRWEAQVLAVWEEFHHGHDRLPLNHPPIVTYAKSNFMSAEEE